MANGYMRCATRDGFGDGINAEDITVDEWFAFWHTELIRDLAANTRRNYAKRYSRNIKPVIGRMKLKNVKPMHCAKILNNMDDAYAGSTIYQAYITLGTMFKSAKLNGKIRVHPLGGVMFSKTSFSSISAPACRTRTVPMDTHLYKLCDEAGNRRFCMHALRHTYATRAIESGMQPKTQQKLLGHSSLKTAMDRYVHVTDDSMEMGIRLFEQGQNSAKCGGSHCESLETLGKSGGIQKNEIRNRGSTKRWQKHPV